MRRHFVFIFIRLHFFYSSYPLIYEDSYPDPPHSDPYFLHSYPDSPYSYHFHPDSQHSHHSLYSVPQFPIPAFTNSLLKCTLNENVLNYVPRLLSCPKCFTCLRALRAHVLCVPYMPLHFYFWRPFLFFTWFKCLHFLHPLVALRTIIFYVPSFYYVPCILSFCYVPHFLCALRAVP